jgi:hypothetical protein
MVGVFFTVLGMAPFQYTAGCVGEVAIGQAGPLIRMV